MDGHSRNRSTQHGDFRRSRQPPDDLVDGIVISAGCSFPTSSDEIEPLLSLAVRVRKVASGGVVAWLTRPTSLRAADADERQALFVEACEGIISRIDSCGIDPAYLRRNRGHLWVSISLTPESGQAGIVVGADMIAELAARGASLDVDALT